MRSSIGRSRAVHNRPSISNSSGIIWRAVLGSQDDGIGRFRAKTLAATSTSSRLAIQAALFNRTGGEFVRGDEKAAALKEGREQLAELAKRLPALDAKVLRVRAREQLPVTVEWLKADGYPLHEERGKLALAALAELTTFLKPWSDE